MTPIEGDFPISPLFPLSVHSSLQPWCSKSWTPISHLICAFAWHILFLKRVLHNTHVPSLLLFFSFFLGGGGRIRKGDFCYLYYNYIGHFNFPFTSWFPLIFLPFLLYPAKRITYYIYTITAQNHCTRQRKENNSWTRVPLRINLNETKRLSVNLSLSSSQ